MHPSPRLAASIVLVMLLLACALGGWWHWGRTPADLPVAAAQAVPATVAATDTGAPASSPATPGAPTAQDACAKEMSALQRRRFEELARIGSPDAVIGRSMLEPMLPTLPVGPVTPPLRETDAELAAAVRSYPQDADLAWYHANRCLNDPACDAGPAVDHLLAVEPDNLAGWLLAVREARRARDEVVMQATLEAAAGAADYEPRIVDGFQRVRDVLKDVPLPASCDTPKLRREWAATQQSTEPPSPSDLAAVIAMALSAAQVPAYGEARGACVDQPAGTRSQARLGACRQVFSKIAEGNALIDHSIGTSMMAELTAGTAEHARWQEQKRRVAWLITNQPALDNSVAAAVRRWNEGEVPAMQRELAAKGLWPPPPSWSSEAGGARTR